LLRAVTLFLAESPRHGAAGSALLPGRIPKKQEFSPEPLMAVLDG